MTKIMRACALAIACALFGTSVAVSQEISAGHVLGNPSAAQRRPVGASLTSMLDRAFCTTSNAIVQRIGGSWVCTTSLAGIAGTFKDDVFTLQDNGDATKQFLLQLSSISTGQTRTWTVPDFSDTFVGLTGAQTLTNKTFTSPVINTPDINGGTADALTSLGIRSTGAAFDLRFATSEVLTADRVLSWVLGDANRTISLGGNVTTAGAFTLSGAFASTFTFTNTTNVTFPTTGTLATLAGAETLTNKTLTSPVINTPTVNTPDINGGTADALTSLGIRSTGAAFDLRFATSEVLSADRVLSWVLGNANRTISLGGNITTAGAFTLSGAFASTFTFTNTTSVTFPTTGTLATLAGAESLTNKSIDSSNTVTLRDDRFTLQDNGDATKQLVFQLSGINTNNTRTWAWPDANSTVVGTDVAQTLTNKTLTSPVINTPDINGGTADALTSLGIRSTGAAFDLRFATSEVLTADRVVSWVLGDANRTISLGGNVTTAGAFTLSGAFASTFTFTNTTSVTFPTTGTLTTLAGSETLTNKTLTSPVINTATVNTPDINGGTADALTSLGIRSTGAAFDLRFATSEVLTADRSLSWVVGDANRTISLGGNISTAGAFTLSGAFASTFTFTNTTSVTFPTTGTLATLAGAEALTNKTIGNSNVVTLRDDRFTLQDDGDTTKQLAFQLSALSTSTTRTWGWPDASSTVVGTDIAQTLTNKTLASGLLTGTSDVQQAFKWSGDISPTALSGHVNDYNPTGNSTATVIRIDGGAADRNITGLAGGADGLVKIIVNAGATNALILTTEDSASTAANRFKLGANLTLAVDQGAILWYDATNSRWRALAVFTTAGGAGSGTVTAVTCGAGLTGGTITTSGTCALADMAADKYQVFTSGSGTITTPTGAKWAKFTIVGGGGGGGGGGSGSGGTGGVGGSSCIRVSGAACTTPLYGATGGGAGSWTTVPGTGGTILGSAVCTQFWPGNTGPGGDVVNPAAGHSGKPGGNSAMFNGAGGSVAGNSTGAAGLANTGGGGQGGGAASGNFSGSGGGGGGTCIAYIVSPAASYTYEVGAGGAGGTAGGSGSAAGAGGSGVIIAEFGFN